MKNLNIKHVLSGLLLFGLILSTPTILFSQGNNNTLSFANLYYDQTNAVLSTLPSFPNNINDVYHGQDSEFTHTAIQNENGDLLFFIVDGSIYDAEGYLIEMLFGDGGFGFGIAQVTGTSETLVVPDPFNCKKYYIFACGINNTETFPFFTILDLDQPNIYHPSRKGAINPDDLFNYTHVGPAISIPSITDDFLILAGALGERSVRNCYFTAPKIQDCQKNQFLYVSTGNGIFQYVIDQNGFSYTNQFIQYPYWPINQSDGQRGEMEIIEMENGHFRLAAPYNYSFGSDSGIALFHCELDENQVLVSGTDVVTLLPKTSFEPAAYINGLEFSPDGNILYITHNITTSHPNPFQYINFNVPLNGFYTLNPPNISDFEHSQIETNSDGHLIFATSNRLGALLDPNNPDPNDLNYPNWNNNFVFPLNYYSNTLNYTPLSSIRGREAYIIPKQIKQRSYSDYIYEGGCAQDLGDQTTYNGTWSPGNNPFNSQNGEVYIDFTLVIPAGSNLTIQDMVFYFTPGSKVIVERGNASNTRSRLTLNNTIFTVDDQCDEEAMWHGVEVHGYANQNQVPFSTSNQGYFRMTNNSGIEHSYLGAVTGTVATESTYPFRPTTINSSFTGGIIQATNSYFKNNRYDAIYHSYIPPNGLKNQGFLTNCDFYTNGTLNDPTVFPTFHILMFNVDGISMKGIRIRNETPDEFAFNEQGTGIASLNSRFFLDPRCLNLIGNCTNVDPSELENLYFGIYAFSSISMRTFRVDRSKFINNYYGIFANGIDMARITRSEFEVYRSAAPNEVFDTYGVFLNSCDGYTVEENFFQEFNDPDVSDNGNSYGIIVQNSGISDNMVYKNEFTNLLIGGQAQRINGRLSQNITPLVVEGLEFKCNTFYKDIFEADLALTSGRIRFEQGDCSASLGNPVAAPAGNLFSYSGFTSQNDFAINPFPTVDQEIKYHHHADNPTDLPVQPIDFNPFMLSALSCASPQNPIFFDENKSCPSKIIDIGIIGVLPLLPVLKSQLDSLKQLISDRESLIDGGNTQELLDMIENNTKPGNIKEALLNASPYLSDEILFAYLSSNPPAGHLNTIIQANSPLSDTVMELLSTMNIPNGITNQINNAQEGTSEMTFLFSEINHYSKERTFLLNRTIQLILNDTIMESPMDTIADLLQGEENRRRREQLCDTYICSKDSAEFMNERNALVQASGLDNFIRMADINMSLFKTGQFSSDTLQQDNNLREEVENIANDQVDRINAVRGEALLDFMLNVRNLPIIEKIDWESVGGKSMLNQSQENSVMETANVKLYPNPTNGEAVTLLFIEQLPENPTVIIYSLTGVEISRTKFETNQQLSLVVKGLNTGLYIISIESNGETVDNLKLIIK